MDSDMTEYDYELLSQYIDGELNGATLQSLRERLMAEPTLRAELNRLQRTDDKVKSAFEGSGTDSVPATVVSLLQGDAVSSHQRRGLVGFAVAATLVVASGMLLNPFGTDSGGSDSLLAGVLEHNPSRAEGWIALSDGRNVRPLLSFARVGGDWCREYLLRSTQGEQSRGVACRTQQQWRNAVVAVEPATGDASEYRPAGTGSADVVSAYIDQQAADIPLSLQQEATLIEQGW